MYFTDTPSLNSIEAIMKKLPYSLIFPPLLILLLPYLFGGAVIWLCHSVSEATTACLAVVLLVRGRKETYQQTAPGGIRQ